MEIGRILLKRRIEQFRIGFVHLHRKLSSLDTDEALELRIFVHTRLEETEVLEGQVNLTNNPSAMQYREWTELLRKIKHDYRNASRKCLALSLTNQRNSMKTAA